MAGITGQATSYSLPNFTGPLFQLTAADTSLLSAIGGLTGGRSSKTTRFEWQNFDLRDASQNVRLEGAAAPTAEERVRATASNICQIHQETVSVSYTKQSATQNLAGLALGGESNPIADELGWQLTQMIKQVARDVNYSFIQGTYQLPVDNTTERKTRGLCEAITTNKITASTQLGTSLALSATNDTVTATAHGLSNGARVKVTSLATTTGIVEGGVYYVVNSATNTFKLSATEGGAAIDLATGDGTCTIDVLAALSEDHLGDAMQNAYDNGGLAEGDTRVLLVGSRQRRAVTAAFVNLFGKADPVRGNVGGVSVQTVETDFGRLNIMVDRQMPADKALILSMEQIAPVFLEVPGKGHFFTEPLGKVGASDQVMLYGEIGLEYGNERAHAQIVGLS